MVLDLMPVSTEAPRCSEFARKIGVLPPGSGLFLNRVVLASVPLPWPKPALNHPRIRSAATALKISEVASRLFAAEPDGPSPFVEVYERDGAQALFYRWEVADGAQLDEAIEALMTSIASTPRGELASVEADGATAIATGAAASPTYLICTQGSHDSCCGTSGVALADELEQARPSYGVRRVSHTGGHRFSPTFLAFPEGRMWAYADLDLVDRIANDLTTAADHHNHSRGWWGAKVGPAQVAECAVRSERAHEPFVAPSIVHVEDPTAEGAGSSYLVTAGDATWHVEVTVGRELPTIACEAPGGLPVKPGREFTWSIERR